MIGGHTYIIGSNHRFDSLELPFKFQGVTARGITIEDNVWIGGGSIVLDGVTIGRNSVIGAGSIVTKSSRPEYAPHGYGSEGTAPKTQPLSWRSGVMSCTRIRFMAPKRWRRTGKHQPSSLMPVAIAAASWRSVRVASVV